ncbi:MAG: NADH-quinone oxidoreductase subunit NuoE [Nitrospiraceae bacterium]
MKQTSSLNLDLDLLLEKCRTRPPNILKTLLAVQEAIGYVPPEAVAEIARALAVTEADVAGVLSFYPDLRTRPVGRHVVRVCMGEACVANHCSRVLAALAEELMVGLNATTPDGRFTLERVYCVGNCAVSPTVMIDEDVHGRVTPPEIPALLEKYAREAAGRRHSGVSSSEPSADGS